MHRTTEQLPSDRDRSHSPRGTEGNWRSDRDSHQHRTPRSPTPGRDHSVNNRDIRGASTSISGSSRTKTSPLPSPPSKAKAGPSESVKDLSRHDPGAVRDEEWFNKTPSPVREPVKSSDVEHVILGGILQLPRGLKTGYQSPSALLRRQPWMNEDAVRHPALIWDLYTDENDEKIARCLQMTSFDGSTIERKYNKGPNAWKMHVQYVPVQQGPLPTWSPTNMPSLKLKNNQSMEKQTYAHIDHYYDIEARFLERYNSRAPKRLTYESLKVVTFKLDQFIHDELYRRLPNGSANEVVSPLDRPGVPRLQLGFDARERADDGWRIERDRYRRNDLQRWTGFEDYAPRCLQNNGRAGG